MRGFGKYDGDENFISRAPPAFDLCSDLRLQSTYNFPKPMNRDPTDIPTPVQSLATLIVGLQSRKIVSL